MFERLNPFSDDEYDKKNESGGGRTSGLNLGGGSSGEPSWLFAEQTYGEALESGRMPFHDDVPDAILERPARLFELPPVRIDLFEE